ncbi:hypothetical protein QRN89_19790 [Streptomyces chengbuensis]|uniref:hypothetical protein n=1 Tax=Streptomyces TaxID=1883 RepID=UPI0025B5615F|nr:hypothetical protein [Streptomyces sp. HUAS CB01]WJY54876.1 hypothetical protein QRN89_19790 [Streptomyces sp. HUAS CB01]
MELAALAGSQARWRVSLHTQGRIGTGFPPRARDHVLRVLSERGVRIEEGRRSRAPGPWTPTRWSGRPR